MPYYCIICYIIICYISIDDSTLAFVIHCPLDASALDALTSLSYLMRNAFGRTDIVVHFPTLLESAIFRYQEESAILRC